LRKGRFTCSPRNPPNESELNRSPRPGFPARSTLVVEKPVEPSTEIDGK
jgi:hypothetical protein